MTQIQNSFLGGVPISGPQALFTKIEIVPPAKTVVDLKVKFDTGLFMGCQALYVDALDSLGDIDIVTSFGQRITAHKGTQGYYPILEGTDMKFTISSTSDSADAVTVFFLNQPIALGVWGGESQIATADRLGVVMIGSGIEITADGIISVSEYELPIASAETLGGIKIGTGLTIDAEGVLNATGGGDYTLPIASQSVLGGVKIGSGLSIDAEGVLSASGGGGGGLLAYAVAGYNRVPNKFFSSQLENVVQDTVSAVKTLTFDLPAGIWMINVSLEADNPAAVSNRTGNVQFNFITEENEVIQDETVFITIPNLRKYGTASFVKGFNAPNPQRYQIAIPTNTTLAGCMISFYKMAEF